MSMWMSGVTLMHPSRTVLSQKSATFVPLQDIREGILVADDDLLLLDDEYEDTDECDWYNEPPAEDFGNLDID